MPPTDQNTNDDKQLAELEAITHELTGVADGFQADVDRLSKEVNAEYVAAEEELEKLAQQLENEASVQ